MLSAYRLMKLLTSFILLAWPLLLIAEPATVRCNDIADNQQRLDCYDQLQSSTSTTSITDTVLDERIKLEGINYDNSFSLIAHNPTYLLPFAYASEPNTSPYTSITAEEPDFDNLEVKFQISFRVPINRHFFFRNSDLWFGYTQLSLWQLYNSDNSAPFRETNYEPELVWAFFINKSLGELNLTYLNFGINHQSNGRSDPLSRSWNRIYVESIWAHKKWAFSFRPWYRIPERDSNDDNPDIEDYLGRFDFRAAYKEQDHTWSTVIRHAFEGGNSHSFYELGYSFSINRKFRGYVQFVSGYGETLIDYNYRNKRFSLGIMLNDWF